LSEHDLRRRLAGEGLSASTWSNGPGDRYSAHEHGYDKALVVASGSIAFGLHDEDRRVDLGVGDRLDLPAGTAHDALVGLDGVTCLEAHAPAGTFGAAPLKRAAGSW
jgi:hypothetical protein